MKPVYDLPGASVVGILATYLSDNPAILTLAEDQASAAILNATSCRR